MASASPLAGDDPARIPVHAIEGEIRRLWRETAKDQGDVVTRACLLTFIALAADEEELSRVTRVARAAAARHPARLLFVSARPGASGPPGIDAEVNAYCTIAGRGRRQVCHEDVLIDARGAAVESVPSAVRPLLVPDLPVLLWMPTDRLASSSAAEALARLADRVIVDTAAWAPAAVRRLLADGAAVSDLAFGRTLPWRRAIASLFDERSARACALDLRAATVTGSAPDATVLAAWIAERSGAAARVEPATGPDPVLSVTLEAGARRLRLERTADSIAATIDAPGACRPWREPYAQPNEEALVDAEIARATPDPSAARSLERSLNLLDRAR